MDVHPTTNGINRYWSIAISQCWWFLDGLGMLWAMITIFVDIWGSLAFRSRWSRLQQHTSKAGVNVLAQWLCFGWCWDATFHREKRQEHENNIGIAVPTIHQHLWPIHVGIHYIYNYIYNYIYMYIYIYKHDVSMILWVGTTLMVT